MGEGRRRAINIPQLRHGNPIPAAAVVGNLLVSGSISGTAGEPPNLPGSAEEQVTAMFDNVARIMAEAGGEMDDIVKVDVEIGSPAVRAILNDHWVTVFPHAEARPARHTELRELPGTLQVRCAITAVLARLEESLM